MKQSPAQEMPPCQHGSGCGKGNGAAFQENFVKKEQWKSEDTPRQGLARDGGHSEIAE